ncbi:MAG: EAL domain-containing protein [Methylococcales bacterium]|nr:EAL domain-containing protein [Methylococcales bacterium]
MKTVSLRLWIPVVVLLLTIVLISGLLFCQLTLQTNNLKQHKIEDVRYLMIRLQKLAEKAIVRQHLYFIEQEINVLAIETGIKTLVLINPQGQIEYANHSHWKSKKATEVIPNNYIKQDKQTPIKFKIELSEIDPSIHAVFPVLFPSEVKKSDSFSYGLLYLHYNLTPALATIQANVFAQGVLLLPMALLSMLILMVLLSYFINQPINHLVRVIELFSENKLAQSELTGTGELAVLGRAFNELTLHLETTQQNLKRQMDLYSLLSASNQLIIRAKSQQKLFDDICQITVEKKQFSLAWIGLLNHQTSKIEVAAKSGSAENYLENIFISVNPEIPEGQGATAIAIRENTHVINNDFLHAIRNKPWYRVAKKKPIQSSAAFPIVKFGLVVGAFNIYADVKNYFSTDLISLLDEMAQDISFALENILLNQLRNKAEAALLEKEKNLSVTLDSIGDGVIVVNKIGLITRMNPVAESLTGWKEKDVLRLPFDNIFHIINTSTRKEVINPIHQVLREKKIVGLANHTTLISKQGVEYQISDSAAPILDEGKQIVGAILVFQDVTKQYITMEALKLSELRFRDVIEASEAYIWEVDLEGYYTYLTEKVEAIKGYKRSELLGHKPFEFMPEEEEIVSAMSILKNVIHEKGKFELTHRNITAKGTILWEEVKGQVVINNEGNVSGLRGVGVSINQRKQDEAEIQRLAYYDSLTSLPNRRMINNRLADEISAAKRHHFFGALLFIDLDHFKNLNDSLGHEVGDELLVQIAKRLKNELRKEDIAARLGGDEFIVLLTHLSLNLESAVTKVRKVTEKLLQELRRPYQLKEHQYYNSSSIGIALFPIKNENAEIVFKQADTALYQAKDKGRNNFLFYHPQMQAMANKRLEIEKDLRIALLEKQLQLYYQPQVNQQKELIGSEVLLRWKHPTKGYIPPDQFIPIAEEVGLIIEIGDWIIQQGFQQIKQWEESKFLKKGQKFSINVSPNQFKEEYFANKLIQQINKIGINPKLIILELTEGTFLDDITETVEKMKHLKNLGFIFSIDDFGTGYSSLSYLKRLPIDELKIDKAFIDDLENDSDDQIIIDTIIAMAKHLKLSVIAEGVETQPQFEFLKAHGCFNYQGYLFSRPLNTQDFEDYMQKTLNPPL